MCPDSMLSVRQLAKTYGTGSGAHRAIEAVDLDVAAGEFVSLLGPSGCGKTTVLRCIAGLERPDAGEIRIGGVVASAPARGVHCPTHRRDIGMVFQSYAIWPHLDVFENVAYPLRVSRPRVAPDALTARVGEALTLVGLEGLARRPATALSGGQQQRVALARALVRRPKLLLLDEPLSNLDARLREQMQHEIGDLVRRVGVTTLHVTHDQIEAFAMANRVAVMMNGRVVQSDTPEALYARPADLSIASFVGSGSVLRTTLVEVDARGRGVVALEHGAGRLSLAVPADARPDEALDVAIRSEDLAVVNAPPTDRTNVLAGTIERVSFRGAGWDCHVRVAHALVRATLDPLIHASAGDHVFLVVDASRCVVFRSSTSK